MSARDYLILSVLGYFGIKIANGATKALPVKRSQDEMTDFSTAMVMSGILYFLNNMADRNVMSWQYYIGFIMGLTTPFAKKTLVDGMNDETWSKMKYAIYAAVGVIIAASFYISFTTQRDNVISASSYLLYIVVVALIALGVIFTKREPKRYPTSTQESDGTEKGVYESSGQYVLISIPMIAWLVSLLYVADSENSSIQTFIAFTQGLFYGVFIGGVSLYGVQYILADTDANQCIGNDCRIKGMIIDDKPYENLTSQLSTLRWIIALTILVLMVMIILFYTSAAEFIPFN